MNSILLPPSDPSSHPHLLYSARLSPSRDPFNNNSQPSPNTNNMSGRKRKASEEPDNDRMSTSPTASPSMSGGPLPPNFQRSIKRTRTSIPQGRPLALPRLLETLSADEMRNLLQNVCDQHPELQQDIVTQAPRPSVQSTLAVLRKYETAFREAFPYGNRTTSDYSYNRVRSQLLQLIEAVREYTPHFLPPYETQDSQSLDYLDAVTTMIHGLPDWDTFQHQRYKNEAYDEIAKAWGLVFREAGKRAGGFHLQFGGWDQKLVEHNRRSGGKMEEAVEELKKAAHGYSAPGSSPTPGVSEERASIRQQLFSGSYGQHVGVGPGGW